MFPPTAVAEEVLRVAASAVKLGDRTLMSAIDDLPVAVYAIDINGFLTYYNPHCIAFAGRTPTVGRDRWCVSWKLYTEDGVFLPHDACPMAVVLQATSPIRGLRAVVERPDGSRTTFMPFPTPVFHDDGSLLGAVNMLIDVTERQQAMFDGLHVDDMEIWHRAVIERVMGAFTIDEVKTLVAEMETEADQPGSGYLN